MTNFGRIAQADRQAKERFRVSRELTIKYAEQIVAGFRAYLAEDDEGMPGPNPELPKPGQIFVHHPSRPQYVIGMPVGSCLGFNGSEWAFGLGLKFTEEDALFISIPIRGNLAEVNARGIGEYAVRLDSEGGDYYLPDQMNNLIQDIASRFVWAIDQSIYPSNRPNPILVNYHDVELAQ